jgi:hypothetical protein
MANSGSRSPSARLLRTTGIAAISAILLLLAAWAVAALCFDIRIAWLKIPYAAAYLFASGAAIVFFKRFWSRVTGILGCFLVVLTWWLLLKPSNHENWQPDVSRTAWAEVNGSQVAIHNFRSCDYRAEFDYTCEWQTRQVDLNNLRGLDLFLDYWGSPWIAHTILSFDFGGGSRVAFSLEARKQVGQSYSAIRGVFRQYTLVSVISDERDVVRLRTNYRTDENLYLFHTTATLPFTRALFLDYIGLANHLHIQPEWYNALTRNCTTQIFYLESMRSQPISLAVLLNGKGDEMEYKRGNLAGDGLPFDQLKRRAYINPAARAADHDPNFSERIRQGRPGFSAEQ